MADVLTIRGWSDDLIHVDGSFQEEYQTTDGTGWLLLEGCGALLELSYTQHGVWRIMIDIPPSKATITHFHRAPLVETDADYSDRLTIMGNILPVRFFPEESPTMFDLINRHHSKGTTE